MSFELRQGNFVFVVGEYPHHGPGGKLYRFPFKDPTTGRRKFESSVTKEGIKEKAALRARMLAAGKSEAATVSAVDIDELIAARRELKDFDVRVAAACADWAWAHRLVGSDFREVIQRWHDTRPVTKRIKLAAAIDEFISARQRPGNDPERTYRSKLTSLASRLGDVYVDEIDYRRALSAVTSWADGGTQNDMAKRLGTLLRWCRKAGYLPHDKTIATDLIDKAPVAGGEIEVIDAVTLTRVLKLIRDEHPQYLAGVVLASLCGLRNDEVHGKRARKGESRAGMSRQRWSDIHLTSRNAHVVVSVAKKRTPSDRHAIIPPAAIDWLKLCDRDDEFVISAGGMERVRSIVAAAGMHLPENCFRHTAISTGLVHLFKSDKARAAENYGTSVQMIDRHYRRPLSRPVAKAWFSVRP